MKKLAMITIALCCVAGCGEDPTPDQIVHRPDAVDVVEDMALFDVDSGPFAEAFVGAPGVQADRVETWTPDPCPSEAWTTPEVVKSKERVLVGRALFSGLGGGEAQADVVRFADEPPGAIPSTWEPELAPGECLGTTYLYFRNGEVVAGGRVIVVGAE